MILLLGSTGYVGSEFARQMDARKMAWRALSHKLATPHELEYHLSPKRLPPCDAVINCAAFITKPSVSLCDEHRAETLRGNFLLPLRITKVCEKFGVKLLHLSTACLFDQEREYDETSLPRRGFGDHCGTYVGTKLLAEEMVSDYPRHYICRIRLPFDQFDNERNYLSKLISHAAVHDQVNSLSHRADCVKAMLDLILVKAPYGIYHCVNPGSISTRDVVAALREKGLMDRAPEFVPGPCAGCTLCVDKLLATGVKIRTIHEAVADAIETWQPS